MNITDAAYSTVHDYPGGSEALAPRLGMSAAVLRNKVNPNNDTHHLTLAEASKLIGITGTASILHALAAQHGYVATAVEADAVVSDLAVLELVTQVWRRNGDVGAAVDETLADGRVELREIARVKEAIYRVQAAMQSMLDRLEGMAEPE